MGIKSCNKFSERSFRIDESGSRVYEWSYIVVIDDPDTSEIAIGAAPDWDFGDEHPSDPDALVSSINATEATSDDHRNWKVVVTFTTSENPLSADPIRQWAAYPYTKICEYESNGQPIVASSGVPLAEAIEAQDCQVVLQIQKNLAADTFDPNMILGYSMSVNSTTFLGSPKETCLCTGITANEVAAGIFPAYYSTTFNFTFDPKNTWIKKIVDKSFYYLKTVGGVKKRYRAMDDSGVRLSIEPWLLDGSGNRLPYGSPPVILQKHIYPLLDFNSLPL